jgi:hypothetical protein
VEFSEAKLADGREYAVFRAQRKLDTGDAKDEKVLLVSLPTNL